MTHPPDRRWLQIFWWCKADAASSVPTNQHFMKSTDSGVVTRCSVNVKNSNPSQEKNNSGDFLLNREYLLNLQLNSRFGYYRNGTKARYIKKLRRYYAYSCWTKIGKFLQQSRIQQSRRSQVCYLPIRLILCRNGME